MFPIKRNRVFAAEWDSQEGILIAWPHAGTDWAYMLDEVTACYVEIAHAILDDDERLPGENPSVGIILCKKADKAYVEYVLQDYRKPMGVATYRQMQDRLRELLPPEKEILKLIP